MKRVCSLLLAFALLLSVAQPTALAAELDAADEAAVVAAAEAEAASDEEDAIDDAEEEQEEASEAAEEAESEAAEEEAPAAVDEETPAAADETTANEEETSTTADEAADDEEEASTTTDEAADDEEEASTTTDEAADDEEEVSTTTEDEDDVTVSAAYVDDDGTLTLELSEGVPADGTYTGAATVEPDEYEDFDAYEVQIAFTFADGALTGAELVSTVDEDNESYFNRAFSTGRGKVSSIIEQLKGSTTTVDAVSNATCSSKGIVAAYEDAYAQAVEANTPVINFTTLKVAGVDILSADNYTITYEDGGTVVFDPATDTLTLTNANIPNSTTHGINAAGADLTIELVGENTITANLGNGITVSAANLTITGSGDLTVKSYNTAIGNTGTGKTMTLNGTGSISVTSTNSIGLAGSNVVIENQKDLTISSESYGIDGKTGGSGVSIIDSAVTINAAGTTSYGTKHYGIHSYTSVAISGDSDVTVSSGVGAISATGTVSVAPGTSGYVEVLVGSSEEDAAQLDGSPYSATAELTLSDDYTYVHVQPYTEPAYVYAYVNVPYSVFYAQLNDDGDVDTVTSATTSKAANCKNVYMTVDSDAGTTSIYGVVVPVKMSASTYEAVAGLVTDSTAAYYVGEAVEDPAV
ncbi:MAG: FMN-binding protein, partial [Clostridiales bacterium]|nr:FMN-binding protein [Clostridiales bacterium]